MPWLSKPMEGHPKSETDSTSGCTKIGRPPCINLPLELNTLQQSNNSISLIFISYREYICHACQRLVYIPFFFKIYSLQVELWNLKKKQVKVLNMYNPHLHKLDHFYVLKLTIHRCSRQKCGV